MNHRTNLNVYVKRSRLGGWRWWVNEEVSTTDAIGVEGGRRLSRTSLRTYTHRTDAVEAGKKYRLKVLRQRRAVADREAWEKVA